MLFTMLCCSYPFERKEDDDQDPRTQTKIMQRILKGESLSSDVYQGCRCPKGFDAPQRAHNVQCIILHTGPCSPMKAVQGIPKRSHRLSLPPPYSSARWLHCTCAQLVHLTLHAALMSCHRHLEKGKQQHSLVTECVTDGPPMRRLLHEL